MTVPRLYRRDPPADYDWTALDGFHDSAPYAEIAQEIDSVRSFAGMSAIDWALAVAPPDGDRMLQDDGAPVVGWPSCHYFGAVLYRFATALLGVDLVQRLGLYVWESPTTWETEEPAPYLLPTEFYALFDPGSVFGFGANFTNRAKWKAMLETLRGVLDDLQVMYNGGVRIKSETPGTLTNYKRTPIVSTEAWTFTNYRPLQTRFGLLSGEVVPRSFTPTAYANGIESQYIVTDGAPVGTTVNVPSSQSGDTTTRRVVCGSVLGSVVGLFRYINHTDGGITTEASSAPSGSLVSFGGQSVYPVAYSVSLGKRIGFAVPPIYESTLLESGQAVSYPAYVFPTMTDEERAKFRTTPGNMGGYFEPNASEVIQDMIPKQVWSLGSTMDTMTYVLEYYSVPNANKDIQVQIKYPVTAARAMTASEESALAATVNYTIDGNAFSETVYPGDTITKTHTLYISTAEITVTATVANAATLVATAAGMWKSTGGNTKALVTKFFTSTGATVKIGGEVVTVVAESSQTTGERFDNLYPDVPLVSGGIICNPIPTAS